MEQNYFMELTVHELSMKFILRKKETQEIIALFTSADNATEYLKFVGEEDYELKESY